MMNNKKDSEIAWISIEDKIKKEWKINVQKEEEKEEDKKVVSFKEAAYRLRKRCRDGA